MYDGSSFNQQGGQSNSDIPLVQTTKQTNNQGSKKLLKGQSYLPLHPANTYLFPQLDGIWQHYQRFKLLEGKV
jgi:hypothetical protein